MLCVPRIILPALLIHASGFSPLLGQPAKIPLFNGEFEEHGGAFNVPTGWTPFGQAKFEGVWNDGWAVQMADVPPGHEVGLYQLVELPQEGERFRLSADVMAGHAQLPVRIGLMPHPPRQADDIVWSPPHNEPSTCHMSVEATAEEDRIIVILSMRNLNAEHVLLEAGRWDNVALETVTGATQPSGLSRKSQATVRLLDGEPTPTNTYENMANPWSLAWPKRGVRTYLASSRNPNPAANDDFDHVEGHVDIDGEGWTILKSIDGPGCISRIWMTNFARAGMIRVEIDGKEVLTQRLIDFFGSPGPLTWPLTNSPSGGWMSYVPMPFRRSARILVRDAEAGRFYWQVTYQRFDTDDHVRSFTVPMNPTDAALLGIIRWQWLCASVDPKPVLMDSQNENEIGSMEEKSASIDHPLVLNHSGMIKAIRIDVPREHTSSYAQFRLQISWDDDDQSSVDVPLELLFATGDTTAIVHGLMTGRRASGEGYCYFPMPYEKAKLQLHGLDDESVHEATWTVEYVELPKKHLPPTRFCTATVDEPRAGAGKLHNLCDIRGSGHLVGVTAIMSAKTEHLFHFLEGDEYITVDGEQIPSTAGTGTEDYFTCGWYFASGPVSLPTIGATEVSREHARVTAYRLHVPDWIPFERSLRFDIEVGDTVTSPESGHYKTVCYYYRRLDGPQK